jgi:predicted nuclease of predicted toxin-antitoxin system
VSVSFYMDEHVDVAITRGLRRRGVDVLTVQEDGRDSEDDPVLLDRATELGHVTFTRDDDFLAEGGRRQQIGDPFAGVIYAHPLRASVGQCVRDLEMIAKASDAAEYANRVEYLPL